MAKQVSFIDKWIILYFRVLPTDPRFFELQDETKELLYYIFLDMPSESDELIAFKQEVRKRSLSANEDVRKVAESMGIDLDDAIRKIQRGG